MFRPAHVDFAIRRSRFASSRKNRYTRLGAAQRFACAMSQGLLELSERWRLGVPGEDQAVTKRLTTFLAACLIWSAQSTLAGAAEGRLRALIVDVGDYSGLARLEAPEKDAALVSVGLRANGFSIDRLSNPSAEVLRSTVGAFAQGLAGVETAIIFFVGYRSTIDGRDYLLAADAAPEAARGLEANENLAAAAIVGALERSGARNVALILNAYSPAQQDGDSARRRPRDLLPDDDSRLALLYAAGPARPSFGDASGDHLFADTLIKSLFDPEPTARGVFDRVTAELSRITSDGRTIWYRMPRGLDFSLGRRDVEAPVAPAAPVAKETSPTPPSDVESESAKPATTSRSGPIAKPARRGRGLGGRQTMPRFPWPPPTPSAFGVIPRSLIQPSDAGGTTLGAVADRIDRALLSSGYAERSFHAAPNGFVMITRLERIRPDGRPELDPRWLGASEPDEFSLSGYLKALFFGDPGRYRLIAFVVTDQTYAATGAPISSQEGDQILRGGFVNLPAAFDALPFTPSHDVTALVYEFERPEAGEVRRIDRSRLSALDHLRGAALIEALADR